MKRNKKGFTIVELVVVIAVIAILAAVLIPTFTGIISKTRETVATQEVISAYKEALAVALSDDGEIDVDEIAEVGNGFTFQFKSEDGTNAEVIEMPDDFAYPSVGIQDGKVVLDGTVVNPDEGESPPSQGGEGNGEDEDEQPEAPVTYTVTKNATNAAIVGADSATEGEGYTATIAVSEHYNTLTVTMGGEDITATAYSNGNVNIPSVTGNIEITVIAAANLSNPDDDSWKEGYRIYDRGEYALSGCTITNYFPLQKGDIVYVKNIDFDSEQFAYVPYSAYYESIDSTEDYYAWFTLEHGSLNNLLSNLYIGEAEEWTRFTATGSAVDDALAYMRLCGKVTDASAVEIHIRRNGEWVTAG